MLAEFVARHAAARNIHYGWVMAALGFVYSLFASSALGVPSVLMREIASDVHVSMGELCRKDFASHCLGWSHRSPAA